MTGKSREPRIVMLVFSALFILLFSGSAPAEPAVFTVRRVGQIVSFGQNAFDIEAPEAGELTISIRNDTSVFRVLEAEVPEGTTRIEWDGCGYHREKLTPMSYHIDAELKGVSGQNYTLRFESPVEYCSQALQFALPSAGTAYLSNPDEWFLEIKTIGTGTLMLEFYRDTSESPVYAFRRSVKGGRINRMSFSAVAGKNRVETGEYLLRVYEISNPGYFAEISLTVADRKPDLQPVSITGQIIPGPDDSDERIWELMTQPAVVVDIRSTDHQDVYEEPDPESASLGTLHGQTQTLRVLQIQDEWAEIEAWNHEEGEKIAGWVPMDRLKIEYPSEEYGLLIDKKAQTMTVFYHGRRIETLLVCTGRMEKNEYYQETAAGSFLTGEHRVDYSTNGSKYDFVIQYDGGNLIHQIPYAFGNGKKDFTEGRALLGAKASHACIRVQAEPGPESGLNAYWLWTHLPYHTRVIILDDPQERHAAAAILRESGTGETDSGIFLPDDAAESGESEIVITFGGDAVLGGREAYFKRPDSIMAYITGNGMEYPFSGLQEIFSSDDLTSINLECVLKSDGTGEDTKKQWRFRGLPEYARILDAGSVELVNLANNHTIDYGEEGFSSTVDAVSGHAVWCGPESPVAVEIRGHRIGFGSCRETAYKKNPGIIEADIRQLKEMGCEVIIYQCHWGTEYDHHRNALQEAMARSCVRAGADLVIGHHPHVVQGIDVTDGVPVVYSLGNLCFGGTIDLDGYDGMLVQAYIRPESEEQRIRLKLIPILTSSSSDLKINDYRPVPADGRDAAGILETVQSDSGIRVPK